jgi:hypothetical protein
MSQGFTNNLTTIPIPVSQGGSGITSEISAYAYTSGTTTLAANGYTKISLDSTLWNYGTYFDTTNKKYLPLVAGKYLVTVTVWFSGALTTIAYAADIYKNGASVGEPCYGTTNVVNALIHSGSIIVDMNGSTDYLEVYGYNGHPTNTTTVGANQKYTYVTFTRLCA